MAGLLEYTKNGQVTEPPLYRFMRGNVQSFLNSIPDPSKMTPEQQLAMGLNANPIMGLLGTTAYHGSPYLFEQFDPKKIGTGQGAQAYGYGTYFAENPKVAESYTESTAKISPRLRMAYDEAGGDWTKVEKIAQEKAKTDPTWKDIPLEAKSLKKGTLYKVDIPDEYIPKMLDFEKPLYKQSNEVKQLAMEYKPGLEERLKFTGGDGIFGLTGADLFNVMQRYMPNSNKIQTQDITAKSLSDKMVSKGIMGSKYLDQGSREVGGTQNYVIFDPSNVKILERNNKGLLK